MFAGAAIVGHAEEGLEAVQDRLDARALIGCGAQGVVGAGRELEQGGVAVWAASLPGARIEPFHVRARPHDDEHVAVTGVPDLDEAEALIAMWTHTASRSSRCWPSSRRPTRGFP